MDVDAAKAGARLLEQGVQSPQRGGERVAHAGLSLVGDGSHLVVAELPSTWNPCEVLGEADGKAVAGPVQQQVVDRRAAIARALAAGQERIAVEGHKPRPRRSLDKRGELTGVGPRDPREAHSPEAGAGRPDARVPGGATDDGSPAREISHELRVAAAGFIAAIEVGLVAELERLQVLVRTVRIDRRHQRARLGVGPVRSVRLEVDAQDQLRPQRMGECRDCDRRLGGQREVRVRARGRSAESLGARIPMGQVGAVPADPDHGLP